MLVFVIILSVLLGGTLFCFIFIEIKHRLSQKQLKDKSNSLRILIIDRKNDSIKYFDKSTISKIIVKPFTEFLKSFPEADAYKLTTWIDKLLSDSDSVEPYLELQKIIKSKKEKRYAVLEAKKIDKENQTLLIESYLFKFVNEQNNKVLHKSSITKKEMSNMFAVPQNLKGYTTVFKFVTANGSIIEEKVERLIVLQLKAQMVGFIDSQTRFLLELKSNEIAIFEMKPISSASMIELTKAIYNAMQTLIDVDGLRDKIKIGGGIIDNRLCLSGFEKHIEKAEETARIAVEQHQPYILYRKNLELQIGDKEIFKTEVSQIINENKLSFLYMPVLQLGKNKIASYITSVKPHNTFFGTYFDALEYARKTEDLPDLLLYSYENLIKEFEIKKDPSLNTDKLYIDANMSDAKEILNMFNTKTISTNTKIGLIFEEKNIDYYLKNKYEEMVGFINEFKAKNFDIALRLRNKEIIFSESIYGLFTSFIIDFSEFKEDRSTTPFRLKLRTIGEKLFKLDKPIMISEVNSWRNIETVIKSGFTLISSTIIAEFSEIPLSIPSRSLKKIKEIK